MMVIPVGADPAQSFNVTLNSQPCTIRIAQKTTGMFLDLLVNNTLIIGGVLCLDRTRIVRDGYLGFSGDLFFADTQGTNDPYYTDLGTRYLLLYAGPGEV
jgi:hypothetical protein